MTRRRGASKVGCLLVLLIAAAVVYFGFNTGEVYYRYYRFRDAMEQEGRFARRNTDEAIRRRLRSLADSLGLPEEAGQVKVRRSANRISISAEYHETVELPMYVKTLRFAPAIARDL
ncbi:MAG: hypothetical protein ACT4P7_14025 [Gemmatimonadaceae bacterium]